MKRLILEILLSCMICMSWNDVGAERIKLLPDSMLTKQEKLVVGGRDAVPGEFPFQVSLQVIGDTEMKEGHRCGGTILDEYTVLTAAHCFDDRPSKGHYEIVAGNNQLKDPHEKEQRRKITTSDIHIHPKYFTIIEASGKVLAFNDIAIITVEDPFTFNDFVSAAKLPEADVYPQGDANVSGWGYTIKDFGEVSARLQAVVLPLLSQEECKAAVGDGEAARWASTLLCTNPSHGAGTPWKGDSGGPLVQDGVVLGVVSTGETKSTLAFYTRVLPFRTWIDKKMFAPTNSSSKVKDEL